MVISMWHLGEEGDPPNGSCRRSCCGCSWPSRTCLKFCNQCTRRYHVNWCPMVNSYKNSALQFMYTGTPYKIQIVQRLKPHHLQQPLEFVLQFLAYDQRIFCRLTRHTFTMESAVNTQNCWICGSTKPLVVHQRPLNSAYVTVWCGFTSTFILGPFFFERITPRGPVRCTVKAANYENIHMPCVIPAWQERNCVETIVFM